MLLWQITQCDRYNGHKVVVDMLFMVAQLLFTCLYVAGVLLTADLLAPTLNFLAELSRDTMMKDWLGQADNCAFWVVLLRALCANGSTSMFSTSSSQMVKLLKLDSNVFKDSVRKL